MSANLEFTDDEYNVMHDATFFIHKKKITDKFVALFGELNQEIEKLLLQYAELLPETVTNSKGKINKGENYEHLPYIILDSPRVFAIDNVFAFRTMFRWGNYFSCTVQLSGIYLEAFKPRLIEFISKDHFNHYYIGTGDDEWQHHFRSDNYTLATGVLSDQNLLNEVTKQSFFKAAIQLPLKKSADLKTEALRFYQSFLDCYTGIKKVEDNIAKRYL